MPRNQTTFENNRMGPTTARNTVRVFVVMASLGLIWAQVTELPEMAFATGKIQPTGDLRRVEHLDGGVVSRILVAEGDTIALGDELMRLSEDDVEAEFESLRVRENVLDQAIERNRLVLDAIGFSPSRATRPILGSPRADAQAKTYEAKRLRLFQALTAATDRVQSAEILAQNLGERDIIEARERDRVRTLHQRGLATDQALYDSELRANAVQRELLSVQTTDQRARSDQQDAQSALDEYYALFRETLLADIENTGEELALVQRAIVNNRQRRDRIFISAPVSGVVQALYLSSAGEVVEPGGLVAEVLPTTERLIAELNLRPSDIGHIDLGDPVEINLTTFNTKRYGVLEGWVMQISPTSTENESRETYFLVRVELGGQTIGEGEVMRNLKAGMEVNASIRTGSRSVMEYMLGPLLLPFQRAFHER